MDLLGSVFESFGAIAKAVQQAENAFCADQDREASWDKSGEVVFSECGFLARLVADGGS